MTYCIGWKTDFGVLVAADTALSGAVPDGNETPKISLTSFGERQGKTSDHALSYVVEEGLKLSVGANFITGFAGDVRTARNFVECFSDAINAGFLLREAVVAAVRSSGGYGSDTTILIGGYEQAAPILLQVELSSGSVLEVDGLVQIGSVPSEQCRWTERMVGLTQQRLTKKPPRNDNEVCEVFTQVIALLQSYGVHDYLLPYGIGGAFVGAWVTSNGARWQGDNLFIVHQSQIDAGELVMCAVMVRDNALCLIGNQAEVTKVLTTRKRHSRDKALDHGDKAIEQYDRALFDYVISINSIKHIVTVVEMSQNRHHILLSLHPAAAGTIGMLWTEKLREIVNTFAGVAEPDGNEMTLGFIPFMPLPSEYQIQRDSMAEQAEAERLRNVEAS